MRKMLVSFVFALSALLGFSVPASAANFLGGCSTSNISPAASQCYGFFEGNVLSGNSGDLANQQTALTALGFAGVVNATTWTNIFEPTKILSPTNGNEYTFSTTLTGITIIGIHFGNGAGIFPPGTQGGGTAFYKFDAGAGIPSNLITAALQGGSSAVLYQTGGPVPEPAAWAMMIAGFGMVGGALRRRTRKAAFA